MDSVAPGPMALSCLRTLAVGLVLGASAGASQAQQCNGNNFSIAFGTVSNAANTDATGTIGYQCQGNGNRTYFRICFFMSGGSAPGTEGVSPRRMTNYNNAFIDYGLYGDAARTQMIGPPPSGGGYPVYTWDYVANGWSNPAREQTVYGRVPPVPAGTPAGTYGTFGGSLVLQYAWSNTAQPTDCFQSAGGGVGTAVVGYGGSSATVSNTCRIALGKPNDLDFGTRGGLGTAWDATTSISLSCPGNTSWKMGLSNGSNAVGTQRRMRSSAGQFVGYELYRNSARTQRWGNDTAGGTDTVNGSGASQANPTVLQVYGRVPAQTAVPAGSYSDTVTVTLEY